MDFVILIVQLTTWKHQDLLLSGQAILLEHGVTAMTAIHTTPTGRPHLSICTLKVQQVVFHHQALTTPAVHDMASSRFMVNVPSWKKNSVRIGRATDQNVVARKRGVRSGHEKILCLYAASGAGTRVVVMGKESGGGSGLLSRRL
jgi:hypothetical protein